MQIWIQFLGISVTLFPVVSKHLSPALVNVTLIAPLWDWRTFCPGNIMLQMVQSDLSWCGQRYRKQQLRNCIRTETSWELPLHSLVPLHDDFLPWRQNSSQLLICTLGLLNVCSFLLECPCGWPCSSLQRWRERAVWPWLLHCKRHNQVCFLLCSWHYRVCVSLVTRVY